MENLTPDQLRAFVYVLFALFAAILTIDKVIDVFKKWRSPTEDTAKKLARDKERLDDHEDSISMLQESSKLQMEALLALLDHELHNGNTDQMEQAKQGLINYLTGKKVKKGSA